MFFGQGGFTFRIVAFSTKAFRFLSRQVIETGMDLVTGELDGGLRRCAPEKEKDAADEQQEDNIEQQGLPPRGWYCHGSPYIRRWGKSRIFGFHNSRAAPPPLP